jgi:hypothetical protein
MMFTQSMGKQGDIKAMERKLINTSKKCGELVRIAWPGGQARLNQRKKTLVLLHGIDDKDGNY